MASKPKEDGPMSRQRHKPEEIVAKLRQGDVLVSQGQTVADAVRSIGVTEVGRYRELEEALQFCQASCLSGLQASHSAGVCARLRGLAGCASPTGCADQATP